MASEHATNESDGTADTDGDGPTGGSGGHDDGEGGGDSGGSRIRAVLVGCVLSVCGLVGGVVVALAGILALGAFGVDVFGGVLLYPIGTILQGLGFGLVVLGYFAVSGRWNLVRVGFPSLRDVGWTVLGLVGLFGAVVVIGVVFTQLDVSTAQNQIEQVGAANPEVLLYMIPLAFLVIGPGEELLFRGAVQGVLDQSFGSLTAILLASALFAVAHAAALVGSVGEAAAYIVVVFCLGAILGFVYERTGNLVVPSLVHGAYNAVVFLSLYVQSAGALPGAL